MSQEFITASPSLLDESVEVTETADQTQRRVYASPGVTRGRKIGTGIFLALLGAFTVMVTAVEGVSILVSTIIAVLFITGFIFYLKIVAPPPFQIFFDDDALRREEQGIDQIEISWSAVVKVKEERFPNGLPISLSIYKRVGTKGIHRAFIIYRDDLPEFDAFLADLHQRVPTETRWNVEIAHE